MQFKITVFLLLFISFGCIAQEVKPVKIENKISTSPIERISLFKKLKPGDFMPGFKDETDFLIANIGNEQYTVKPADLAPLIIDVSWMSAIPPFNAYISYYKNGRVVYTNAQYVLGIDTKNINPKIFKKIKYYKEIIKEKEKYVAKRNKLERFNDVKSPDRRCYFIEYPTNKYFLYFNVYIPLKISEMAELALKLKDYDPSDYYCADGGEKFANSTKRTINMFNTCEYYFTGSNGSHIHLGGYNTSNERLILMPIKVYCKLDIDECPYKFDAEVMRLFYGKPIEFFKEAEQKNNEYILEWFDY